MGENLDAVRILLEKGCDITLLYVYDLICCLLDMRLFPVGASGMFA
jgi:hypothetical protein